MVIQKCFTVTYLIKLGQSQLNVYMQAGKKLIIPVWYSYGDLVAFKY